MTALVLWVLSTHIVYANGNVYANSRSYGEPTECQAAAADLNATFERHGAGAGIKVHATSCVKVTLNRGVDK
jgi:hypothetical protein